VAFEQAQDRRFLKSSPAPLAPDPASAKITLINFNLAAQRRLGFAQLRPSLAKMLTLKVGRVAVQAGELGNFSGFHIQTKPAQRQPEFRRRNSRTPKASVSHRHQWLLIQLSHGLN